MNRTRTKEKGSALGMNQKLFPQIKGYFILIKCSIRRYYLQVGARSLTEQSRQGWWEIQPLSLSYGETISHLS